MLVHPYDDPLVIAGQGTVGLELVEQVPDLDVVIVPVGGGGLISGITVAVKALRPGTRIIAVEPVRLRCRPPGLEAGQPVPLPRADRRGRPPARRSPARSRLEVLGRHLDDPSCLVTEDEIREGMRFLYQPGAKLACEGGGAAGCRWRCWPARVDVAGRTGVPVVTRGGNVSPRSPPRCPSRLSVAVRRACRWAKP